MNHSRLANNKLNLSLEALCASGTYTSEPKSVSYGLARANCAAAARRAPRTIHIYPYSGGGRSK